jgi:hypothetical protein
VRATPKPDEPIFSYKEFREVTELTKKEADSWVQNGLITAELASNGRRRLYTWQSLMEGSIAKQLADFSSRELLPSMMEEFRRFLRREKLNLAKIEPDYSEPHQLVKVYTRDSPETIAGGGVRGVMAYVDWFDLNSKTISKSVYLIVDLTLIAVEVLSAANRLK